MEAYKIKIDAFEGPFDLLFHLIEKNKIDIYDIPISLITGQYLDYIEEMRGMDLDVASEFLVMASTLLHIKSRMLLPAAVNESGEDAVRDPRDELVVSMLEYRKYKEFTASLRENAAYWGEAHYRPAGLFEPPPEVANKSVAEKLLMYDIDGNKLVRVYRNLLELHRRSHEYVGAKVKKIIERESVTLALKAKEIVEFLATKPRFLFQKVFNPAKASRLSIIMAFVALLELSQKSRLTLRQKKQFGGLMVSRKGRETA